MCSPARAHLFHGAEGLPCASAVYMEAGCMTHEQTMEWGEALLSLEEPWDHQPFQMCPMQLHRRRRRLLTDPSTCPAPMRGPMQG